MKSWMNLTRPGLICASIAVILAGTLVFFWFMARPNEQERTDAEHILAEMKQIDARWTADVLSLQLGLNGNYDAVAAPVKELDELYRRLRSLTLEPSISEVDRAMLEQRFADYSSMMEQKSALVDRIKAQYAILSNSSRLLTSAAEDLSTSLRAVNVDPREGLQIADLLNVILVNVTGFVISPYDKLRDTINSRTDLLSQAAARMPEMVRSYAELLIRHCAIILRQRQTGGELVQGLVSLKTGPAIESLADGVRSSFKDREDRRLAFRDGAIVCSVLLALALCWLARLIYIRDAKLQRSNSVLQKENEEAQEQLIQSGKLAAMGQMVAGITHEINTPLAYLKATFGLLKEQIADLVPDKTTDGAGSASRREQIDIMTDINMLVDEGLHGIDEISTLILTMKNFSRVDRGRLDPFSVEEGLESALLIARSELKYSVDIEREYTKLPIVPAASSQIKQVFLNIINNAAQAMAGRTERGCIFLRTALQGDMVRIEIADNGPGMTADIKAKIFDPFFTTKDVGSGSGMGLSICHRIVHNHGGQILVESEPDVGTTFIILLPIQPPRSVTNPPLPTLARAS